MAEQTEERGGKNEKQDGTLVQHDQDGLKGNVCWETESRNDWRASSSLKIAEKLQTDQK